MTTFPYYEFFFALASYVLILVFAHFARQKPPLFPASSMSARLKIVVFGFASIVAVMGGAWSLAKLQHLGNGLVFYGGLIGFLVFAAPYCRIAHIDFVEMLNRLSPGLALAHAVGRIGCAIEGCCYGTRCDLP
ncbi:MAG: prolipoprotein diacylglyceryl transferase family protein, partial [Bdellovibrionota bacterium]